MTRAISSFNMCVHGTITVSVQMAIWIGFHEDLVHQACHTPSGCQCLECGSTLSNLHHPSSIHPLINSPLSTHLLTIMPIWYRDFTCNISSLHQAMKHTSLKLSVHTQLARWRSKLNIVVYCCASLNLRRWWCCKSLHSDNNKIKNSPACNFEYITKLWCTKIDTDWMSHNDC